MSPKNTLQKKPWKLKCPTHIFVKEICHALCKQKWKKNISSFGEFVSCFINVNETNDHKIAMDCEVIGKGTKASDYAKLYLLFNIRTSVGVDKLILKWIWNFFGTVKPPKKTKNNKDNKVSHIDEISMWPCGQVTFRSTGGSECVLLRASQN